MLLDANVDGTIAQLFVLALLVWVPVALWVFWGR